MNVYVGGICLVSYYYYIEYCCDRVGIIEYGDSVWRDKFVF